ncbi:YesL family protein [Lentibacillus saliphilus]|uniref:YesL family protein n=1 Tax=Lentibacillus saliphilus TaxID=2737028 RepID=UPI001C30E0B4|nr:DUF624 domain-containing protein [Lentibacillus saliphilus]
MSSVMSVVFKGSDWFMRIVKLNVTWLLFSVVGLLVFSVFPATYAAFVVTNRWVEGDADIPIWKTFVKAFKTGYWRSQVLGTIISIGFLIIYVDIQFFKSLEAALLGQGVQILLLILLAGWIITSIYVFPTAVQFDLSWTKTIKTAFFSSLSYIHWTVINVLGIAGILLVSYRFPASVFFLTGGTVMLWITCMTYIVKQKIASRYEDSVTEQHVIQKKSHNAI